MEKRALDGHAAQVQHRKLASDSLCQGLEDYQQERQEAVRLFLLSECMRHTSAQGQRRGVQHHDLQQTLTEEFGSYKIPSVAAACERAIGLQGLAALALHRGGGTCPGSSPWSPSPESVPRPLIPSGICDTRPSRATFMWRGG